MLKYFWICCFTVRYISESKIDRKLKRRVLDIVNSFSFIKTVSNNCITVENVVTNIFLFCKAISEFVASRLVRSRSHKSIENVKNRSSYIEAPIRMCRKSSVEHARWSTRCFHSCLQFLAPGIQKYAFRESLRSLHW